MRLIGASELEIVWRATSVGFSLEESDDLSGALWNPVLSPPTVTNGETKVTLTPPTGDRFYRLRSN